MTSPSQSARNQHLSVRQTLAVACSVAVAIVAAGCGPAILQASVAPGPPVRLQFAPHADHPQLAVTVSPLGIPPMTCQVPCEMTAPAGNHVVSVVGTRQFAQVTAIPPYPSRVNVRFQNVGLRVAGGVLTAVGSALVGVSSALFMLRPAPLGVILGMDGVAIGLLIPALVMVAAAGSDHLEFEPAGEAMASRAVPPRDGLAALRTADGLAAPLSLLSPRLTF